MLINLLLIAAAYLIGSLSSAIIVCRMWGLPDPRSQGSNNPGATNVMRIGGKAPAIITLLGDGCKGFLPTLLVMLLGFPSWVVGGVMLAALVGHIFPVFFDFKGGKGVATAMGAFLGLNWLFGAILIVTWFLVIKITRISSLGAIVATVCAPVLAWFLLGHDLVLTVIITTMSVILLLRHKDNIVRLLSGQENKV
jgi:glycerol-3-phosphate acyltransferase PlsY